MALKGTGLTVLLAERERGCGGRGRREREREREVGRDGRRDGGKDGGRHCEQALEELFTMQRTTSTKPM